MLINIHLHHTILKKFFSIYDHFLIKKIFEAGRRKEKNFFLIFWREAGKEKHFSVKVRKQLTCHWMCFVFYYASLHIFNVAKKFFSSFFVSEAGGKNIFSSHFHSWHEAGRHHIIYGKNFFKYPVDNIFVV